jgi:alpha-beta hydrolase superfamily lysophospholipase
MLTAETLHPEGARYAASLVCVPGLWAGRPVWRGFASYLAHRGWECHLVEVRDVVGGVAARGAAVADYAAALPGPAILLGHDAGALVALAAAAGHAPSAVVLLAPVPLGGRGVRLLVLSPRSLVALLAGRRVPPPEGRSAAGWLDLPAPLAAGVRPALGSEDAESVRDVVWGRFRPALPAGVPALVVSGEDDHTLTPRAAAMLAGTLGAEQRLLRGIGHWALAGSRWQDTVALVHRWLVQRLGEPLLELYAEALAEREGEDGGDD